MKTVADQFAESHTAEVDEGIGSALAHEGGDVAVLTLWR